MIHPVTGFVAYNGQQSRLGGTMAVEDVNKAGGIKSMGGAKLEALLGDSQSKVEVGVERSREDERAGRRGLYRLLPEPGRHRRQPGRRQVRHALPGRCRRLRPAHEPRPEERVPPEARLRRLRRRRHRLAGRAEQGRQQCRQDRGDRPRVGRVRHRHGQAARRQAALDRHRGEGADRARQSDAQLRQYRAAHPFAGARHRHDVELRQRIHAAGAHALPAEGECRGLLLDPGRRLQLQVRQGDARRLPVHDGREPLV